MRLRLRKSFVALVFLLALHPAPAKASDAAPAPDSLAGRDLTQGEAARALDSLFRGRPNEALGYLATLETRAAGEPLFHIVRARCYQEFVPMDDADNAAGRERSKPALQNLDRCIDVCTRRLDAGDPDPRLSLYRGWAWMSKAYVRSMTRDFYSAGREAKKGKTDLERYLAERPDDPTATGLLGAFLYFADTVPGAFKFLSKLLMLPTGDRDKGLEDLQIAVRGGGLMGTDWKIILYNVYFYFEGRFEEGIAGLQDLIETYPEYARTAIPLAVSRPYAPSLAARNDDLVETTISRVYGAPNREVDWNALYLVQLSRAYGDRYCSHSRTTEARLRSIIHESPRHPDWVSAFARLELGRLYASRGKREEAVALFESVARGPGFDYLRKEAEVLLRDVGRFGHVFEGTPLPDMDEWVWAVYRSAPDSIAAIRGRFAELATRSVAARFYTAECDLLLGNFDGALQVFTEVISAEAAAWDQTYQMIASTRIAEIYASREDYKTAARYQGIALSYYHNEYLVDWVLEGRKRYFERLGEGKEALPPPTLFSANVRAGRTGGGGPKTSPRVQDD